MHNHKYGSEREGRERNKICKRGAENVNKQLKGMQMMKRKIHFRFCFVHDEALLKNVFLASAQKGTVNVCL